MKAALVVTGSEIVTGRRADALVQPIAGSVSVRGIVMAEICMVGDDPKRLKETIVRLMGEADLVVVTGGLGLTPDDTTRRAVEMLQAEVGPAGHREIPNPVGSASGIEIMSEGRRVVFLPGVPAEALAMIPSVLSLYDGQAGPHEEITVFGLRETEIASRLGALAETCSFLPKDKEVTLIVPGGLAHRVRSLLGRHVTQKGGIASDLGTLLRKRRLTCAAAESCTGGLVGHLITEVPGSSAYFLGSVIAYDNHVKERILGVDRALLERHGAVSEEVARAMLAGVLVLTQAHVGMAVTGIAGPDGGTPDKPVGTVWICVGTRTETRSLRFTFPFDRAGNKMISAKTALFMLRELVHDQDIRGR